MLMLKNPMPLQSTATLNTCPDMLGEKIRTNYQLIGTDLTSEDLLYMTMQAPDIYVNMEDNQTLVVDNPVNAKNALKLDLINQLVNRIMFINSPHFTYQDESFVTSVLQKMGIMNVEEFVQQVRRHMGQNGLLTGLIRQYSHYGMRPPHHTTDIDKSLASLKKEYASDFYLNNQIFRRLMTAECNNIMYAYNHQTGCRPAHVEGILNATLLEQTDAIVLTQYRENLFDIKNPAIWQEYMNYEIKPLGNDELTEQRILQRMATAILENMIQKLSYEQQFANRDRVVWKDYTSIFCQCAEDVVRRFQNFQGGKTVNVHQCYVYMQGMSELVQDELKLIQLLEKNVIGSRFDMNNSFDIDNHTLDIGIMTIIRSVLENQNLQKLLAGRLRMAERLVSQTELQNHYLNDEAEYIDELRIFQEAYQDFTMGNSDHLNTIVQETPELNPSNMVHISLNTGTETDMDTGLNPSQKIQEPTLKTASETQETVIIKNHHELSSQYHQSNSDRRESYHQTSQNNRFNQGGPSHQTQNEQFDLNMEYYRNSPCNYMEEFLNRYESFISNQNIPPMENAKLLEQINRHNLHMKKLLDSKGNVIGNVSRRVMVDREKARHSALRALENPQEVLTEIHKNADAIKTDIPDEIKRILSVTDEHTRTFYERLLGYRKEETTARRVEVSQQQLAEILSRVSGITNATLHVTDLFSQNTAAEYSDANSSITINNAAEKNITEKKISERNVSEKNVSERNVTEENVAEKYVTENSTMMIDLTNHNATETLFSDNTFSDGSFTENGIIKDTDIKFMEKTFRTVSVQNSIHSLLEEIRKNENRLYQEIILEQNDSLTEIADKLSGEILYGLPASDDHVLEGLEKASATATFIVGQMSRHAANSEKPPSPEASRIEFVHKTEEPFSGESVQYAADNIVQSIREQDAVQKQMTQERIIQEQTRQEQTSQKHLQDMMREQINRSEQHIAQLVSKNIKTQVHTISDMVYLELERRLKNEQRRRGY